MVYYVTVEVVLYDLTQDDYYTYEDDIVAVLAEVWGVNADHVSIFLSSRRERRILSTDM